MVSRVFFFAAGVLVGDVLAVESETNRQLATLKQQRKTVVAMCEDGAYLVEVDASHRVTGYQSLPFRLKKDRHPNFKCNPHKDMYITALTPKAHAEMKAWRKSQQSLQEEYLAAPFSPHSVFRKRTIIPRLIQWIRSP